MNPARTIRAGKGQALTEFLIVVPILCLFAAGILQFAILFLADIQFEHACGETARRYCAKQVDENSFEGEIWMELGAWGRYFDRSSLRVSTQPPSSAAHAILNTVQTSMRFIPFLKGYEGAQWKVQIRCRPPLFFAVLFPRGVPLNTELQAYRYRGAVH